MKYICGWYIIPLWTGDEMTSYILRDQMVKRHSSEKSSSRCYLILYFVLNVATFLQLVWFTCSKLSKMLLGPLYTVILNSSYFTKLWIHLYITTIFNLLFLCLFLTLERYSWVVWRNNIKHKTRWRRKYWFNYHLKVFSNVFPTIYLQHKESLETNMNT